MEPPPLITKETYKEVVIAHGLPIDIEDFEGFSLCWIGSKNAKHVIVYTCGGGFLIHAYDVHVKNLINGYNTMKANNQDVSVVILSYGLCPDSPWPSQVRQIVATTQHLLKLRRPENIHFSGDSAGGTLILAFLLHHLHHNPNVPPYTLPAGSRFGSALLISPGAPAPALLETASANQNPNPDTIKKEMVDGFWATITSTSEEGVPMPNPWIDNMTAEEGWWKDLPIGKVKVMVGGNEILRDSIAVWSGYLKKVHGSTVEVEVFPGEIHDQALVDMALGIQEEKASTKYWKKWFKDFKD